MSDNAETMSVSPAQYADDHLALQDQRLPISEASKLLPCPTCSHEHLGPDGAYVRCQVCIFDPVKDPKLQGCWITVPG